MCVSRPRKPKRLAMMPHSDRVRLTLQIADTMEGSGECVIVDDEAIIGCEGSVAETTDLR